MTEKVLVITQDGRTIVVRPRPRRSPGHLLNRQPPDLHTNRTPTNSQGQLEGFDQTINVILSNSVERVYSLDEAVEEVPLGLYVVRGDNIVSHTIQPARPDVPFIYGFQRPLTLLSFCAGCDWGG